MKRWWLGLAAAVVLAGTGMPLGAAPPMAGEDAGIQPAPPNTLVVPPRMRLMVHGEMRFMLETVQGILEALGNGRLPEMAPRARQAMVGLPPQAAGQARQLLPPEFRQLGNELHQSWGSVANALEMEDREGVVAALAETTALCNACHATYRMVDAPEPGSSPSP